MYRKTIFLFILIITSLPTFAQVSWGGKGGATVSTLGTSVGYQPRLAYHAGFYYAQHVEDQYGLQVEFLYSMQGARVNNGVNGRLNYHYIALPITLKLYFAGTTYADLGTQPAYLLNATYREIGFKENRTASVNKFDIVGLIGFGKDTQTGGNMGIRVGIGILNPSGTTAGIDLAPRNLFMQFYVALPIKEFD